MHVPVGKTFPHGQFFDKIWQELILVELVNMNYCTTAPLLAGFRGVSGGKTLIRFYLSVALVPSVNWHEIAYRKVFAYVISRYQKV